jgi:uncharacterized protein (TIGR02996 family)
MSQRPIRAVPDPLPVEPWLRQFAGVEGFLRAIAEEPWDDAHRLILADWLDERGASDRAQFIRLQCRQAAEPSALTQSESVQLRRFLGESGRVWLNGLPSRVFLVRGLATGLSLHGKARDVLKDLDSIAGSIDVQTITTGHTPEMRESFKVCLGRCRVVELTAPPAGLLDLLKVFRRQRLAFLNLASCNVRSTYLEQLLALSALQGLLRLNLRENVLGCDGARVLARAPFVETLEQLNLAQNELTDQGLVYLTAAPWSRLRWLDLSFNQIGVRGIETLVNSPMADGLFGLALRHNCLPAEAIRVLAASPRLGRLRRLALAGTPPTVSLVTLLRQRWPDAEILL